MFLQNHTDTEGMDPFSKASGKLSCNRSLQVIVQTALQFLNLLGRKVIHSIDCYHIKIPLK